MAQWIFERGNTTEIRVVSGDSFYATLSLTKDGEAYVPQVGDVFTFRVRTSQKGAVIVEKAIPTDALILTLTAGDTQLLSGAYWHEIEYTNGDGDADTFVRGRFIVE